MGGYLQLSHALQNNPPRVFAQYLVLRDRPRSEGVSERIGIDPETFPVLCASIWRPESDAAD